MRDSVKKGLRSILTSIRRIGLINDNFTIISNNCFAGFVYQKFDIQYNTPFIGLFILGPDYIYLLKNFNKLIKEKLDFINANESRYKEYLINVNRFNKYQIGKLGDKVEIHFLHYKSQEEAKEKWNRRVQRINFNNILFKFSDNDLSNEELIQEFDELPYKNKICFTSKDMKNIKCQIYLKKYKNEKSVENEWAAISSIKMKKIINKLYL